MEYEKFLWHKLHSNDLKNYSSCIYCIRNLKNNKLYIGKTASRLYDRIKGHIDDAIKNKNKFAIHLAIKKHDTESFVVSCVYLANPQDLNSIERFFIAEFNSFVGNNQGYNMTLGGEGNLGHIVSLEARQQISLKNKGVPMKESVKAKISKQVHQIDKDTNEIITTYESVSKASKATGIGNIALCCKGRLNVVGGYKWRFVDESVSDKSSWNRARREKKKREMQTGKRSMFRPVTQYDLEGHFIAEFESIDSAIEATGVKNISMVCRGVRNQAGGYFWKYA